MLVLSAGIIAVSMSQVPLGCSSAAFVALSDAPASQRFLHASHISSHLDLHRPHTDRCMLRMDIAPLTTPVFAHAHGGAQPKFG